ncbi:hypothetical protein ACFL1N_04505 [Thermodesulfobacteriota bacterium]
MVEVIYIIDAYTCPSCGEKKLKTLFPTSKSHFIFEIIKYTRCRLVRTLPSHTDDIHSTHDMTEYYGSEENKFIPFVQNIHHRFKQIRAKYF